MAPVSRPSRPRADVPVIAVNFPHANLPSRLSRMVGRDDEVLKLSAQLNASRLVTIVGVGGVGKTTVAVAVAHHLIDAFAGAVLFADLGMLDDPGLVTTTIASMLGLSVQSSDATPNLIAYLRNKRILLILDTCEHLVEAVATMAASIIDKRRRSTFWRQVAKRFGSKANISTDWMRLPVRRTTQALRRRSSRRSRPLSCSRSGRRQVARD